MPRYKLRTLLIVLALGPPIVAWAWGEYRLWKIRRDLEAFLSANKTDCDVTGAVSAELWSDLTSKRHPIIQIDLANQDEPAP